MKLFNFFLLCFFGVVFAECPEGFYEDDCGNCWLPYCYNYTNHSAYYDLDEDECLEGELMWVIPGDQGDPYFNNYCDSCPDGFSLDDCGHCWMPYCYTFFTPGLDGDPQHSVYYDLSEEECEELGYGYYFPGNPADPYFNSNCTDEEPLDECETCMESCISYVMENYGYTEEAANEWCASTPNSQYGCADSCEDQEECTPGDDNGDDEVNVLDIVAIVSMIVADSNYYTECADFNSDNSVNVLDIVAIVSIIITN